RPGDRARPAGVLGQIEPGRGRRFGRGRRLGRRADRRRAIDHERAARGAALDPAAEPELLERGHHGVPVDPELLGQRPGRRQALARLEPPALDVAGHHPREPLVEGLAVERLDVEDQVPGPHWTTRVSANWTISKPGEEVTFRSLMEGT